VRSNHHILNSNVRALVYYTRWPASNDPVADLKECIEDLLRMLEVKIDQLENPEQFQCVSQFCSAWVVPAVSFLM